MEKIKVIKRDNSISDFQPEKISIAINKAMKYGAGINKPEISDMVADKIKKELIKKENLIPSIYQIEEMVFKFLVEAGEIETARKYEGYKEIRASKRVQGTIDNQVLSLIKGNNHDLAKENSNKDAVLNSTQRDLIAGEVSKDIAMRKLIPAHLVQAHKEGVIHIHDTDYILQPLTNCCLINLGDMLQGTVINKRQIKRPKSFQVACTVTTQIIAQVASNQYGGQSIDLKHLAPFVEDSRKKYQEQLKDIITDKTQLKEAAELLVRKEVKSGIQTMQYQINTLMTTNGQAPFVTVFMNIHEGDEFEDDYYLIIREMLEQRIEGVENEVGIKSTPTFPKLIFVLNKDNREGGKYYDLRKLAAECTARRMYPDYISEEIMKENYEGNVFSPMGCRSFLNPKKFDGEYKFEGRFNFGVQTINLVQIAILAKKDIHMFYSILKERLQLIRQVGELRYEYLKEAVSDVSPIHWQHGAIARLNKGEKIGPLLKNGYSTTSVGYIGLNEVCESLIGEPISTEKGEKLAQNILNFITEEIVKWREETGLFFSLYATPGESTAGKLCEKDIKKYGIIPKVTDKGYYTNSYHVTPSEEIDAFSKILKESKFQKISTGGCITYVEMPNLTNNVEAILSVMNFAEENIMYSEFNTKLDNCHECGFEGEIEITEDLEWKCPNCGNQNVSKMNIIRRTCGYLGENDFSDGRKKDIKDRKLHL